MKWHRIAAVVHKEAREIVRDPITLGVALLMPLVMLLLFGYAISLDIRDIRFSVLDHDGSAASRELVERFTQSGYFVPMPPLLNGREVEASLRQGQLRLAVIIPPGFQQHLYRREQPKVQLIVDGTYATTATLAANYAQAIVAGFRRERLPVVRLETRAWYNPGLQSRHDVVPGLYAVILLAFPPLLTALAIVREKESGAIQQIYASPLSSAEFIAGKLIPYGLIAFLELTIVIAAGYLWFDVPFRGSLVLLLAAGLIYVLCTVGIGLLVSTVTQTQLVAMLASLIITLMPSFLFSGLLFPIFTMPYVLQLYTAVFPGRYFVDVARGIVLKDAGLGAVWLNTVLLAGYTLLVFMLAAWRLRKKVA